MSVGSVLIGLQASHGDGQGVTTDEFLVPLNIQSGEVEATRADGGAWASGMVYLAVVRLTHSPMLILKPMPGHSPKRSLLVSWMRSGRRAGFDLVFSIGTTSLFPYISYPVEVARERDKPTVEINLGTTRVSGVVRYRLAMGAALALDAIWRRYNEKFVSKQKDGG